MAPIGLSALRLSNAAISCNFVLGICAAIPLAPFYVFRYMTIYMVSNLQ
jgi:hypothetical protein